MAHESLPMQFSLPTDQLMRWKDEAREIERQISDLSKRLADVNQRIAAAQLLFGDAVDKVVSDDLPAPMTKRDKAPSVTTVWEDFILATVAGREDGVSYPELRAILMQSHLGEALSRSTKTYERAMRNLANREQVKRGYQRVFTPEAFEAFDEKAKATGNGQTLLRPLRHSPMGDAILRIVHASSGIANKEIIARLREDPEFNATLTPYDSGAYNIIARLTRRDQIVKRDDGANIVGPNFPYDFLGLTPEGEGAPNGSAAGAPFTGRAATLPFDSREASRPTN